jgi:hypothetical protein
MTMFLVVLLPLIAVAIVCVLFRRAPARLGCWARGRVRHALGYRLRRLRLPRDWWEQFEQDFAAYVDPAAARARERERR